MRHPTIIGVLSTLLLLGFADLATSQQSPARTISPNDLVGQWDGQWQSPRSSGGLHVTIKNVDRDQVSGTIYIRCDAAYCNRDLMLVGTLRGNTLAGSFPTMPGQPLATYEWEISEDGKSMAGWGQIGARSANTLTKTR